MTTPEPQPKKDPQFSPPRAPRTHVTPYAPPEPERTGVIHTPYVTIVPPEQPAYEDSAAIAARTPDPLLPIIGALTLNRITGPLRDPETDMLWKNERKNRELDRGYRLQYDTYRQAVNAYGDFLRENARPDLWKHGYQPIAKGMLLAMRPFGLLNLPENYYWTSRVNSTPNGTRGPEAVGRLFDFAVEQLGGTNPARLLRLAEHGGTDRFTVLALTMMGLSLAEQEAFRAMDAKVSAILNSQTPTDGEKLILAIHAFASPKNSLVRQIAGQEIRFISNQANRLANINTSKDVRQTTPSQLYRQKYEKDVVVPPMQNGPITIKQNHIVKEPLVRMVWDHAKRRLIADHKAREASHGNIVAAYERKHASLVDPNSASPYTPVERAGIIEALPALADYYLKKEEDAAALAAKREKAAIDEIAKTLKSSSDPADTLILLTSRPGEIGHFARVALMNLIEQNPDMQAALTDAAKNLLNCLEAASEDITKGPLTGPEEEKLHLETDAILNPKARALIVLSFLFGTGTSVTASMTTVGVTGTPAPAIAELFKDNPKAAKSLTNHFIAEFAPKDPTEEGASSDIIPAGSAKLLNIATDPRIVHDGYEERAQRLAIIFNNPEVLDRLNNLLITLVGDTAALTDPGEMSIRASLLAAAANLNYPQEQNDFPTGLADTFAETCIDVLMQIMEHKGSGEGKHEEAADIATALLKATTTTTHPRFAAKLLDKLRKATANSPLKLTAKKDNTTLAKTAIKRVTQPKGTNARPSTGYNDAGPLIGQALRGVTTNIGLIIPKIIGDNTSQLDGAKTIDETEIGALIQLCNALPSDGFLYWPDETNLPLHQIAVRDDTTISPDMLVKPATTFQAVANHIGIEALNPTPRLSKERATLIVFGHILKTLANHIQVTVEEIEGAKLSIDEIESLLKNSNGHLGGEELQTKRQDYADTLQARLPNLSDAKKALAAVIAYMKEVCAEQGIPVEVVTGRQGVEVGVDSNKNAAKLIIRTVPPKGLTKLQFEALVNKYSTSAPAQDIVDAHIDALRISQGTA